MAKEVSIEEGVVKVVRCSVTNEPMQNVPGWYSEVKVRFVSDKGRKTTDVHADFLPPDEPVVKPVDEEEGDISLDELQDEEESGEDVDGVEGEVDVVSLLEDDTDDDDAEVVSLLEDDTDDELDSGEDNRFPVGFIKGNQLNAQPDEVPVAKK
jgi:hypothetical protein